jgi:hypothetical protein
MFSVWSSISDTTPPRVASLCLTYSIAISGGLSWLFRQLSEFELLLCSVERISHFTHSIPLEVEKKKPSKE